MKMLPPSLQVSTLMDAEGHDCQTQSIDNCMWYGSINTKSKGICIIETSSTDSRVEIMNYQERHNWGKNKRSCKCNMPLLRRKRIVRQLPNWPISKWQRQNLPRKCQTTCDYYNEELHVGDGELSIGIVPDRNMCTFGS